MGSKPSKQDPFSRAETWLRQRKDAKIDAHDSSARSLLVRWPSLPSPFVEDIAQRTSCVPKMLYTEVHEQLNAGAHCWHCASIMMD